MKAFYTQALAMIMLVACLSCDNNASDPPQEPIKNIEGSWKVVSVTRNDVDITDAVDFSQFKINFNQDNTYSFENYLPFIVKEQGTWSLDDPQYPFKINFMENTNAEAIATDLTYPIVQGKRQIRISFSPGCHANTYAYVLERVNE